jgi:hypothetical protein
MFIIILNIILFVIAFKMLWEICWIVFTKENDDYHDLHEPFYPDDLE